MAAITIKNVPDALYEQLKAAAQAHHRSINGEVIAALERSLASTKAAPETQLASIRALRAELTIEPLDPAEIAEAIEQGRP
ncbi:MAG: Arc family DNA-binding protein [Chromatiales bacterium]|jgi:plasmid stability protein